ncbi:MAG TPA: DUF2935 domain-containing protein [Halanaerobiales bacterium]|nr:DUF2935 domain-containing protein [Halanaerobiales bacterium]
MKHHSLYLEQIPLPREIKNWIELLIDHARFMRNGFNTTEEYYFQQANNFSRDFVELSNRETFDLLQNDRFFSELQDEVNSFIEFKNMVARGIEDCRILSILPSALINHIKREAIFFSGILARIKDEPGTTWDELGLPDSRIAETLPQALIPGSSRNLDFLSWEELLFWMNINYEHAFVLSLYFRPEQETWRQRTVRWSNRMERLYDQILRAYQRQMTGPEQFIEPSRDIITEWTEFLENLYSEIDNCTIPGRQMNIWPRVINHMIREAVYFIQVLAILNRLYRA